MIIFSVGLGKGKLSQCNRRNTAIILRALVKSHNGLEGTKVFACGCSGEISIIYQSLQGRARAGVLLFQPVIAYKRLLGQLYQKRNAYTETFSQALPVNFEKNYEHGQRLPLK